MLSEAAESVSVGYQYLPFEVYARSDFRSATADAYTWSAAKQAYDRAKARKDAGLTNDDGGPITLPDRPGKKITLMSGIAAWQRDLKEYGVNQASPSNDLRRRGQCRSRSREPVVPARAIQRCELRLWISAMPLKISSGSYTSISSVSSLNTRPRPPVATTVNGSSSSMRNCRIVRSMPPRKL